MPAKSPLIVDTRISPPQAAWIIGGIVLFCGATGTAFFRRPNPTEATGWTAVAGMAFSLGLVVLLVALILILQAGRWSFDERGVYYEPAVGTPRYLRWDEVRQLRWLPLRPELRGDFFQIPIHFDRFPKETRAQAQDQVAGWLTPHFDLSTTPPKRPDISWTRIIVATVPLGGVLCALARWYPLSKVTAAAFGTAVLWPYLLAVPICIRQHRRMDNPRRWRQPLPRIA